MSTTATAIITTRLRRPLSPALAAQRERQVSHLHHTHKVMRALIWRAVTRDDAAPPISPEAWAALAACAYRIEAKQVADIRTRGSRSRYWTPNL